MEKQRKRDRGEDTDDVNDDDDDDKEEEGVGGVPFADWVEMARNDKYEAVGGGSSSPLVGAGRSSDEPQGLLDTSHPMSFGPFK